MSTDSTAAGEARDSTDARTPGVVDETFLEVVAVEAREDRAPVLPGMVNVSRSRQVRCRSRREGCLSNQLTGCDAWLLKWWWVMDEWMEGRLFVSRVWRVVQAQVNSAPLLA